MIFLKTSPLDDFGYLILYASVFIVCIIITRLVFSIPQILENIKAQTRFAAIQTKNIKTIRKIISKVAEKQGLSPDEIQQLMNESDNEIENL